MANFKISGYPAKTVFNDTDLYDVSTAGTTSEKMTYLQLKTDLSTALGTGNIYTTDGTLAGTRIMTMGANDLYFNGAGNVGVGLSTGSTAKLQVKSALAGNAIIAQDSLDVQLLKLYDNGKLEIGGNVGTNAKASIRNDDQQRGLTIETIGTSGGLDMAHIVGTLSGDAGIGDILGFHSKITGDCSGTSSTFYSQATVTTAGKNMAFYAETISGGTANAGIVIAPTVFNGFGLGNAGVTDPNLPTAILHSKGADGATLRIETATASATGEVWTATDALGNGEWGAAAGGETLAQTLVLGRSTGATNLQVTTGQDLEFGSGAFLSAVRQATLGGNIVLTLPAATGTVALLSDLITGTAFSVGTVTSTQDIDLTDGDFQYATVDKDVTFTFSNPPVTGLSFGFTVELTKDATVTARLLTFPASVKWDAGVAPVSLISSSQIMILSFITRDGGTTYFGVPSIIDAV